MKATPSAGSVALWGILLPCCVLPLAWVLAQVVSNPVVWREAHVDAGRLGLLSRTFGYSLLAGATALVLAIPACVVIGRGGAVARTLVWAVVPVTLLLPSIVYAYGWSQFLRLGRLTPFPQSAFDVLRCVWSLATWLWPAPAVAMGLALRRVDQNVQQQALLDGALLRVTARQLLAPAVASVAIVTGLAAQEFAVYEPTGISVLATEIRMVYETGAFGSTDNPITQPMGGGIKDEGERMKAEKKRDPSSFVLQPSPPPPTQSARSAAAVAVALPGLVIVVVATAFATLWLVRVGSGGVVDTGPIPSVLRSGTGWSIACVVVFCVAVVVPVASLVVSLKQHRPFADVWDEFSPQVLGSLLLSAGAGAVAFVSGCASVVRRNRAGVVLAMLTFLIGGQILAIALVRIYNHPVFESWLYNGPGVVVVAYVARFGWIALLAGAATWSRPWRELRELASVDGAGASQTASLVILPLAWPVLAAAGLFVMVLSLTEVPATVLLSPQRPPTFTPMLMQWVHMLRSDPMIEGSLLLVALVLAPGLAGAALVRIGLKLGDWTKQGARRE